MNRRGNPASLAQARRRDSLDKRSRVLTTITALEHNGQPVTHVAVARAARAARVSTWLTYAPGIREHIEAAQTRQASTALTPKGTTTSAALTSLRTELDLTRQEIKELRTERDQLQGALRHQLGQQLDTLHTPELVTPRRQPHSSQRSTSPPTPRSNRRERCSPSTR
ncbi:DUF6262 family protein [Streptomyces justiciae]|uniref:DUF6262 family protein n=1 Tax=Streptomyces justiciae TaxID=2780140 RepID=A0ABU3M8K3_9ACTN|nr:DUF6262 family protein [Streptomyces justiciae]MDT7847861.1 DUF6262 family protein [Streptomyces justiciae]